MAGQQSNRTGHHVFLLAPTGMICGVSSRVLSSFAIVIYMRLASSMASSASAWRFRCRMQSLTT